MVARWARISDLRLERHASGTRIVVTLNTPTGPAEVACVGETLIEAAAAVPTRLGETRLELPLRELVGAHSR